MPKKEKKNYATEVLKNLIKIFEIPIKNIKFMKILYKFKNIIEILKMLKINSIIKIYIVFLNIN